MGLLVDQNLNYKEYQSHYANFEANRELATMVIEKIIDINKNHASVQTQSVSPEKVALQRRNLKGRSNSSNDSLREKLVF